MRRGAAAAATVAALLAPGSAFAHAFSTGRDAYGNFLEGAGVALASPGLLLPVLALAVMLGLWQDEGLLKAWPHALVGSVAGLLLAPFVGPWVALATLGIGAVLAVITALVPLKRLSAAIPLLAGFAMLMTLAAALEGHDIEEIPNATRVGLLFGVHFALAAGAGLVRVTRERILHAATTIGWRIAASWLAAILVLYLAFSLAG